MQTWRLSKVEFQDVCASMRLRYNRNRCIQLSPSLGHCTLKRLLRRVVLASAAAATAASAGGTVLLHSGVHRGPELGTTGIELLHVALGQHLQDFPHLALHFGRDVAHRALLAA